MGWQRAVWLYGGGTVITNTYFNRYINLQKLKI